MTHKTAVLYPDHPMYTEAVDALKRYHEAQASDCPAEEIEHLRQIAESQFQAVNEISSSPWVAILEGPIDELGRRVFPRSHPFI